MSKKWGVTKVLFSGERYRDEAYFEIVTGKFTNIDGTQERIGVQWKNLEGKPSKNYPQYGPLALPSRPEEIEKLISVLRAQLPS